MATKYYSKGLAPPRADPRMEQCGHAPGDGGEFVPRGRSHPSTTFRELHNSPMRNPSQTRRLSNGMSPLLHAGIGAIAHVHNISRAVSHVNSNLGHTIVPDDVVRVLI